MASEKRHTDHGRDRTLKRLKDYDPSNRKQSNPWKNDMNYPHSTTTQYLQLTTNINRNKGKTVVHNGVVYDAVINGTVVVGYSLLSGASGSPQEKIGQLARQFRKDFPPDQKKFPPGVKKLRVARNVTNEKGENVTGQLRRYQPQMNISVLEKTQSGLQRDSIYWSGGSYTDPWVCAAITQIVKDVLDSKHIEKKIVGDKSVIVGEDTVRNALAQPLIDANVSNIRTYGSGRDKRSGPEETVEMGASTDPYKDIVISAFEHFLKNQDISDYTDYEKADTDALLSLLRKPLAKTTFIAAQDNPQSFWEKLPKFYNVRSKHSKPQKTGSRKQKELTETVEHMPEDELFKAVVGHSDLDPLSQLLNDTFDFPPLDMPPLDMPPLDMPPLESETYRSSSPHRQTSRRVSTQLSRDPPSARGQESHILETRKSRHRS